MAIEYKRNLVVLSDIVAVDDAENLLQWLQKKPGAKLDFSACTHVHPANLQVLMAADVHVSQWPNDASLAAWLKSALAGRIENGRNDKNR